MQKPLRQKYLIAVLVWAGLLLACQSSVAPAKVADNTSVQRLLSEKRGYYPRVIRLAHNGSENGKLLVSFDSEKSTAQFYSSADDGRSWQPHSSVRDSTPPGHCCSGLYEVPQNLGKTKEGTLFWATSVGKPSEPRSATAIRIYQSTDAGKTWAYFSTPLTGKSGLWEAEFIIDSQGHLVMYYSSEEHKDQGYNQLLAHKVSTDGGLTWGEEVWDVAMNDGIQRPGMAIVRRLATGTYIMSYEICGSGCDVFVRTSADGTHWGTPTDRGTRVESTAGNHFAHAPTIEVTSDGDLLVIGQLLMNNQTNRITTNNGKILMINSANGTGLWKEMPAPVVVAGAKDDPCPNYSSQLLLSADKKRIIEITTDYDNGICKVYFNNLPFQKPN